MHIHYKAALRFSALFSYIYKEYCDYGIPHNIHYEVLTTVNN